MTFHAGSLKKSIVVKVKSKYPQFLLEFTNLQFKQGIASVFRPKKELKRTPTIAPKKPKPLSKETIKELRKSCEEKGFVDSGTDEAIKGFKKNRGAITKDRKGVEYYWSLKNGSWEFDGANKCYPSGSEFEAFFKSKDVVSNTTYGELLGAVNLCRCILNSQVNLNNGVEDEYVSGDIWTIIEKYRKFLPEDLRKRYLFNYRSDDELDSVLSKVRVYIHDGTIPLRIYAELLNFIHSNYAMVLRQCFFCGSFWIPEKKLGRPDILYCSPICEHKTNPPTHYDDRMNKRLARKAARNNEKPKIIKHLINLGYSKEEAEGIYNKIPQRCTATYNYFIKKWANPKGCV